MDNVNVNLKRWLKDKCEYQGCLHNRKGECGCNDTWFLNDILNLIRDDYEKHKQIQDNININCNQISVPKGYCEFCGAKVIQQHIKYDEKYKIEWHCSKGCF